ncbi:MAG TPA: phospholipid carrier-dependent glycosyltransferase [Egibacteraceae bacterium]|nr:phospholipid carrier-dependent glycosyltransferase [Egibacteraceae bacterium]
MSTGTGTGASPPTTVVGESDMSTAARVRQRRAIGLLVPLVLLIVAGGLRFHRLDEPPRIYFDEVYYVTDARSLLELGTERGFSVHPPLGKWIIAGGIATFGDHPFGWRATVAVAGTLTVLATYLAGLRLFRRRGVAALAAVLLAVDGLAFTMSRIAMLDAFLALFVVVGFWLLVVDRDGQWAAAPHVEDGPHGRLPRVRHPYRWLAGLAFGLALATKWSAVLAIGAAGLLVIGSELAWRHRATGSPWTRVWAPAVTTFGALIAVPVALYVASYAGWFANFPETRLGEGRCPPGEPCDVGPGDIARAWVGEQRAILRYHQALDEPHPYRSPAQEWPVLRRPVAYHYETCDPGEADCTIPRGTVAHIVGLGNPALWWLSLLAYPGLLWLGMRHRDWRAWAVLAFLGAQYVPWLLARRPLFLFYLTPVVPFMALALAFCAGRLAERRWLRWTPWAVAAAAGATFAFFYPIYAALPIDLEAWQLRMWFDRWI